MLMVADSLPTIETGTPWQDLVRLAAIFIPGIIVLAMGLVVFVKYTRVYMLDRKLTVAQGRKSKWRGLLPIHVAAISFSYMGLVVMLLTSVAERFREPLYSVPRTIVYSLMLCVGALALHIMTSQSRRRSVQIEQMKYPKATSAESGPPAIGRESGNPPPA